MTFMQSWLAFSKLVYKWGALPIAIVVFLMTDGWVALRVVQHGYAESSGMVTLCTCGRGGVLGYTYTANDAPQHRTRLNQSCQLCERMKPGERVPVFYSTRQPELSVVNATPRKALKAAVRVTLLSTLLLPLLAGLALAFKNKLSSNV
jgi:hypothetical protein